MIQGLENMSYEDKLKKLVVFNLEKRLQGDMASVFRYR